MTVIAGLTPNAPDMKAAKTPLKTLPNSWDTEPHVRHDLEQYRATHFTVYLDPLEKVHRVSKRT